MGAYPWGSRSLFGHRAASVRAGPPSAGVPRGRAPRDSHFLSVSTLHPCPAGAVRGKGDFVSLKSGICNTHISSLKTAKTESAEFYLLIWGTKDKEDRCLCGGFTSADRIPPKPGRAVCLLALGLRTQFAASRVWGWARPEGRPEQQKPFQTPLRSLLIFFKHADGHWGTVKNTRVCISVSCCGESLRACWAVPVGTGGTLLLARSLE